MIATQACERTRRESGFAMIEVVLAIAILAFISMTVWGTFSRTYKIKRRLDAAQERLHTARVALMRITRELEMAYLSNHENTLLQERRTFFVGEDGGAIDSLRFTWFGKQRMRADAAEGDNAAVMYYPSPDPDDPSIMNLMRRETRRLQAEDPMRSRADTYILCPNVESVKFSYYDARLKEWREQWNTMGADGVDYLPTHVRVALTVIDEREKSVMYASSARLQMTEKVQHMPTVGLRR